MCLLLHVTDTLSQFTVTNTHLNERTHTHFTLDSVQEV